MKKEKEREYELNVRVLIRDTTYPSFGQLEIEEIIKINASSFLEMTAIIGKFHELAQKIDSETKEGK